MPQVKFTANLKRFYPDLAPTQVAGDNISEVLVALNQMFPGLRDYVVDEQGRLRKHVNIFIGNEVVRDREKLSDIVTENDDVYIMQALSGG